MNKRKQRSRNLQAGFTLIELIVVIVIIGIMAAVAIPRFSDLTKSAQSSNTKGMAAELSAAAAMAYAKTKTDGTTYTPSCAAAGNQLQASLPTGYAIADGTGTGNCVLNYSSGGVVVASAPFTIPTE